ncbi:MAG TPA: hypothetical protein VFW52_03065 [Candidatus Saccharimonadales bacterium]|nr:hypothetical protein [Candidatus Saccharimonadales bacterium]
MTETDKLPCADKLAFDSKSEAEAEARVVRWRHGNALRAYRCRYCGLWHLSSSPDD